MAERSDLRTIRAYAGAGALTTAWRLFRDGGYEAEGGEALSPVYDATTSSPPVKATLGPGAAVSGCSAVGGGDCHKFKVTTTNDFKAGSYKIECYAGGTMFGNNAGYAVKIPSGGSVTIDCYNGFSRDKTLKIIGGDPGSISANFG